jgi:hypothetical protein
MADQFITTMNQAAEQAVPAAATVFADSLKAVADRIETESYLHGISVP